MITEDYVSFETARLLKEKGFDEPCIGFYNPITGSLHESCVRRSWDYNRHGSINAPTHQMAMAWLREVHNIFIEISVDEMLKDEGYQWALYDNNTKEIRPYAGWGGSYEEALEEALKYSLKNLI